MSWTDFRGGAVYWSAATGAHMLYGAILGKYRAWGGPSGFLGAPTADQTVAGVAYWCDFQGGSIYDGGSGGRILFGDVLAKYRALGGSQGFLGAPTTDMGVGRGYQWCYFQYGVIVSSPATGAHVVYGAIRDKYLALGGGYGFLGAPTSDEVDAPGGRGRVSHFEYGDIYWSAATGARVVYGAIREKYEALGGAAGWVGLPTTDEVDVPGGRVSRFQGADIYWSPATGAHEVHGAIRDAYNAAGGAWSSYGLPTSDEFQSVSFYRSGFLGLFSSYRRFWVNTFQGGEIRVYM